MTPTWLKLIAGAIAQRCAPDGNYVFRRGERWFYVLKAVVAVVAGRQRALAYRPMPRPGPEWQYDTPVEVADFNMRSWAGAEATMYEWESLVVPHGLRGWAYDVRTDGAP